jgi:hypothetical protein
VLGYKAAVLVRRTYEATSSCSGLTPLVTAPVTVGDRICQILAEHHDTAILPTRSRKPRDKAAVEVSVQIVQRFVLARFAQPALLLPC